MRIPSLHRHALLALAAGIVVSRGLDAASTSFWQVSTQVEFLKGDVEQVSIDSDGRISLGPALEELHDSGSPAVWRLLADANDAIWAGTGSDGRVWKVDRDGKATMALDAAELDVHALAAAPGGGVYAGSSPDGKVYRLSRDGTSTTFFDPEDKYIWSLATGPDGSVYVGTGEKGRIYRVGPDGTGALFYETDTTHVTALAWDPRGSLLVGTSSPGRVLRIDPSGKAFVLLESAYREVRGLRPGPDGQIYVTAVGTAGAGPEPTPVKTAPEATGAAIPTVSTEITVSAIGDTTVVTPSTSGIVSDTRAGGAQKGAVYRIAPDGDWTIVWDSPDDMPYDVALEPTGALLVATGGKGKLYRLSGNPTVITLVTRAEAQQITGFAHDRSGRLLLATSNPGRILRVASSQATKGSYVSEVRDTATVATWGAIRWRAVTPAGTRVELFTRAGNTRTPDKTWSPWSKAYTAATGEPIESPKARYLQWKADLTRTGTTTSGPLLTSVTAAYLPRNTRPVVDSITVHPPGVAFQRPYPTGDPELAGFDANTSDGRQSVAPSAAVSAPGPTVGRRTFQKSLQTFVWQARDPDGDRLQFDVFYRLEGETSWKLLKRGLFDEIYTWDTTSVPDGTYVIKVVSSDSPSNAASTALQGERESTAFDVDNTPPLIDVPRDARAKPNVLSFTVRDSQSPVQRVEYSSNAGRWNLAYPVDGLLDSREERFELQLTADGTAAAGPLVLRVTDALGNVATAVVPR